MAAPLFHSWGWLNHRLSALLDSTEIMVPRPTADAVLSAAAHHRAELIITTPVVVRRLAEAGPGNRDLSALRGVLVSGAPLPADVIADFRRGFGDCLFNLYGSTEVGYATVATPADLAAAPDTAGRPLAGVTVAILDDSGAPVATRQIGNVWVGSSATFDGYLDGGDKERRPDGLVATGDIGRFDDAGRLFIKGRSDDLIISGGENVHPTEVEDVLRTCAGVADVAAVGRPDERFGQHVACYVVPTADADRPGYLTRSWHSPADTWPISGRARFIWWPSCPARPEGTPASVVNRGVRPATPRHDPVLRQQRPTPSLGDLVGGQGPVRCPEPKCVRERLRSSPS
jgi:fatty-acyl-CoA synthase